MRKLLLIPVICLLAASCQNGKDKDKNDNGSCGESSELQSAQPSDKKISVNE